MVNRAKQGGRDRYWKSTRSRYERRNESVWSNVSSCRCCVRVCVCVCVCVYLCVPRVTCFLTISRFRCALWSDTLLGLRTTVLFPHSLLAAGRSRGPPLLLLSHVYPRADIHFRQQPHRAPTNSIPVSKTRPPHPMRSTGLSFSPRAFEMERNRDKYWLDGRTCHGHSRKNESTERRSFYDSTFQALPDTSWESSGICL